jgi:tRNA (cmo5U34)-methyltransferase
MTRKQVRTARLYSRPVAQFHFDPDSYLELMAAEVPAYGRLQDEVAAVCRPAARMLELGTGTGETARRVLARIGRGELVGIDASERMLAHARRVLPGADLRVARLEDPLPEGPFGLVFSALAVHHLDGPGKSDLFARVAGALAPGGRFVLGDVVVPEDSADVVTPIDGVYDQPSGAGEQLEWLAAAGLRPALAWAERDLAVMVADRPS